MSTTKITSKQVTPEELTLSGTPKLTKNQLVFLMSKTPAKYRREKPAKGGGKLTYVSGGYVTKVLNLMFGFAWSFEVQEHQFDLDIGHVVVLGRLSAQVGDTWITKEQFGRADIKFYKDKKLADGRRKPLDVGNDLKAASTDALKKCASLFGIAADVYHADEWNEVEVVDEKIPERTRQLKKYLDNAATSEDVEFVIESFRDTYGDPLPSEQIIISEKLSNL
jgi:recombination DNA repair RAD52 pathway protein